MNGVWMGGAPEATTRLGRLSNSNSKQRKQGNLKRQVLQNERRKGEVHDAIPAISILLETPQQ
jgi:hypothetical protein